MSYSERYYSEIDRAREAWERRMNALPHVSVTQEMYDVGLDAMPDEWKAAQHEVFTERLEQGGYELSYSQMCNAAFGAGFGAFKVNFAGDGEGRDDG